MRIPVSMEIAAPLLERHGSRMYVVSQEDWKRHKRTLKGFPQAYAACKKMGLIMTPLLVKHGNEVVKCPRRKR
jgi:hypothetical protein